MNKQVSIKEAEKDDVDEEPMTISEDDRDIEVFGSDFISVGMAAETQDWLPFNSDANFILFNDDYNDNANNSGMAADSSLNSNKRKLGAYYSTSDVRLNPMSIRYRATDKNRQKREKKTKEKSMKSLEQSKFTKKKK